MKPKETLIHNVEHSGVIYKYDLPVVNQPIQFRGDLVVKEEVENTPVENLMEHLSVDKETAYESFIVKLNQEFNNEVDMYGDIRKAGDTQLKVRKFFISMLIGS